MMWKRVITTDPAPLTAVKKGDTIVLTVSSGTYVVIEDYTGKDFETVAKNLEELGLNVKKEEEISDTVDKGKIISQSLDSGEKLKPDEAKSTTITLTVSKGYESTVPNVYGQDITTAKDILEKAGFKVTLKVLTPPTTAAEIQTMKINVVQSQSIKAFTVVYKKNQEIILEYYDHKPDLPADNPTTPGTDEPNNSGNDSGTTTNPTN